MGLKKSPLMKLVDIQFTAKELMKAGRNMDIALEKPKMQRLVKKSSEEEYKELEDIVKSLDVPRLRRWASRHSSKDLEDLTVAELREKAKKLHIKNYSRMEVGELLEKVEDAYTNRNSRRDGADDREDDSNSQQSQGD